MGKGIRGITIELDAKTTGLDKALADVNKRSKELNTELRDVNKLLKFSPDSTVLLEQKQKLLGDQVQATSKKLETLRKAEAQVQEQYDKREINEEQYRDFQREIVETESKLEHYKKQLQELEVEHKKLGESIQNAGKKIQEAGDKMYDVGKTLTKGLNVPITAAGTAAFKAAMDFETGMAGVRKTTDMTAGELDEMAQSLRDMAKEVPASVTDLTELAETAGQLGIEKENIVDFTRVMADLAVATDIIGSEGATNMAQFANIMQMSQKDFDRAGSAIVELGNNTATTESKILDMSKRLAAAGAQAKMSESDVLGIAAGLSSLGLEAQAGGSAFSKVINQIQLEVDTGADTLQDYASVAGMTADEFSKAWGEDAAGALTAFITGLGDTERLGRSTNEILDQMGISELRMGDALRRTSNANELFTNALAMSNRAWEENSALTTEASILYETTESKLRLAKNQMQDAAIELGQKLTPVITTVIEKVSDLVSGFTELSPKTQDNIIKFAGFAAILGPAITVIGKVTSTIGKLTNGIGSLVLKAREAESIKDFISSLSAAGKAGLVGAAAAAVGALTLLIAELAKTPAEIKKVKEAFESASTSISKAVGEYKAQTDQIDALKKELDSLTAIEKKSVKEKERLSTIVAQLNELMPELNLQYDEEADKLNLVGEALNDVIASSKSRLYQEMKNEIIRTQLGAQAEAMGKVVDKQVELEKKERLLKDVQQERYRLEAAGLTEAEQLYGKLSEKQLKRKGYTEDEIRLIKEVRENVKGSMNAYNEQFGVVERGYSNAGSTALAFSQNIGKTKTELDNLKGTTNDAATELDLYINALEETIEHSDDLAWQARETSKIVEESHQRMTGAVKDASEETIKAYWESTAEQEKALAEAEKQREEELKALEKYQRELDSKMSESNRSFSKFSDNKIDLANTTKKKFMDALEKENKAFKNYHENLQKIAQEQGPETAELLASFGPEAASLIQDFIDGADVDLKRLAEIAFDRNELAKWAAVEGWDGIGELGEGIGTDWIDGIIDGMNTRRRALNAKATELGKSVVKATKVSMDIASPSKEGIAIGENFTDSIGIGMENRRKELAKKAKSLAKDVVNSAKEGYEDIIDRAEKYVEQQQWIGNMSLSAEGYYWRQMYTSLKKGTDEYERALKNHQNVVKQMRSEMESATEKYSEQVARIDSDLANETERINQNYETESKRIKDQLARDTEQIQNELISASEAVREQLESDIKSLEDAYKNAYDNRVTQLTNITGLFARYQRKTAVPEAALIRNLASQVDALQDYSDLMAEIGKRVDNEALINELEQLGPNSLAELEAINRMSDEQLAEFVGLYEERYRLATEQATKELEPLKSETEQQIRDLNATARRELASLQQTAAAKLNEINRIAAAELNTLRAETKSQLEALNEIAAEELATLEAEWIQTVTDIVTGSEEQFDSMYQVGLDAIDKLEQGMLDSESSLLTTAESIASKVQSVIAAALNIPASSLPDTNAGAAAGQLSLLNSGSGGGGTTTKTGTGVKTGTGNITQNITIISPEPLTPSEVARQTKNASRVLAMEA